MYAATITLSEEIAKDRNSFADEREIAWAIQHTNVVALDRNPFAGEEGITNEHAEFALADYRRDHRRWNERIYENELRNGMRRCSRETGKGYLPSGTIVHNIGNADYAERHLAQGYADAVWTLSECPGRDNHKPALAPYSI